MENCKEAATPIATRCYLDAYNKGANMEQTIQRADRITPLSYC